MGIETAALLGYLGTAATVATAGAAVYSAVETSKAAKKAGQVKVPTPTEPPKSQATKNADRNGAIAANAASAMPGGSLVGNSGTFLTGPGGVDASQLNLGKNVLLGQ